MSRDRVIGVMSASILIVLAFVTHPVIVSLGFISLAGIALAIFLYIRNEKHKVEEERFQDMVRQRKEADLRSYEEACSRARAIEEKRRRLKIALATKRASLEQVYRDAGFEPEPIDITIDSDQELDAYYNLSLTLEKERKEAEERERVRVAEERLATRKRSVKEAKAKGLDVCEVCMTVEPDRCRRCGKCLGCNQEYYSGLCYSCSSDDDDSDDYWSSDDSG